jgi:PAS domain S-box-containing protein
VVTDSNDAITIQDVEGRITAWNRGAELMYGYSEEEALHMNICHLTPPDKEAEQKEFTRRLIAGETVRWFETQRMAKDGRILDIWLTVTKLIDEAGKPIGIASTERDITERKRLEKELKKHHEHLEELVKERTSQLEASNKDLEAFSYSVSHDLRAPLRAIDGFSRILLEDCSGTLDDKGRRWLDAIRRNTQKMGQLIDDLLMFSRMGRHEMISVRINMEELAREVCEEFKAYVPERTIRVKFDKLPPSRGDRSMLREVYANLLSNAIKFTQPREEAVIEIGGAPGENEHIYYVRDNGVGFDMRYVDKLFGMFQRLHSMEAFEGTGVGLAIVQRIIHRHGGRVWAEGAVGKGAAVYFTLPVKGENDGKRECG